MTATATTTVKRTASYLGMSEAAVYAAVARRQLPFRKLGRKLVFDIIELDAYMHQLEGVGVSEAVVNSAR